jgi:acyl-CoA thioesterase II
MSIDVFVDALDLEATGPGRFRAKNLPIEHDVVFGGQLMAQVIIAARRGHPGMTVLTVHTVFARAARPDAALDIVVEPVHTGRTFASTTVTVSQGDRVCTRSSVVLHTAGGDLIRHGDRPPITAPPEDAPPVDSGLEAWEVRVVGGVDVRDPEAVGPAELDVWTRFVGAPDDDSTSQALLAFATDGFLIGTAMRPHRGVGQAQAHRTLATAVISHTLTFHEPCWAGEWLLLCHRSPYAGRGRSYGRADVFRSDGQVAASFVQDSMIRPIPTSSHRTVS